MNRIPLTDEEFRLILSSMDFRRKRLRQKLEWDPENEYIRNALERLDSLYFRLRTTRRDILNPK